MFLNPSYLREKKEKEPPSPGISPFLCFALHQNSSNETYSQNASWPSSKQDVMFLHRVHLLISLLVTYCFGWVRWVWCKTIVTNTWIASLNVSLFLCVPILLLWIVFPCSQLATKWATCLILKPLADHSGHSAEEGSVWDCKSRSWWWRHCSRTWLLPDPRARSGTEWTLLTTNPP